MDKPQLTIGASLAGFLLFWAWLAVLPLAHDTTDNIWVVGILPQVLVGTALGVFHRWVYIAVAFGMSSLPIIDAFRSGPYTDCAYVVGWPLLIGGLLGRAISSLHNRRGVM